MAAGSAVKLCGMRREEDIAAVNALLPEYIGFIFWVPSKRYVSPEAAGKLKAMLDERIKAVGVFVNEEVQSVAQIARQGIIDCIQLHGDEDEAYIKELRKLTDKPIIQAIRLVTEQDADRAERSSADHVLLDSGKGGGKLLDWELAARLERPFFLAGGLSVENVAQAVEKLQPFAVDVSSGIETGGVKDPKKMEQFVEIVRRQK